MAKYRVPLYKTPGKSAVIDASAGAASSTSSSSAPAATTTPSVTSQNASVHAILSNPIATIATHPDGTGGDFSTAVGTCYVFSGNDDVTGLNDAVNGPVYTLASVTAGLTATIGAVTGAYSASLDDTHDSGEADFKVAYGASVMHVAFTVVKNKNGKSVIVRASAAGFSYQNGSLVSGQSDVTLKATTANLSGSVAWSSSPSVTLTVSGDTATLSAADFDAAAADQVTISATLGGITDYLVLVKLNPTATTPEANASTMLNPGFEAGDMGWTKNGWSIVNDSANANNGSWYATITGSANPITNEGRIPTDVNNIIRVHASFKSSSGAGTAHAGIAFYDHAGALLSRVFTGFSNLTKSVDGPSTSYGIARLTALAPVNARSASFTAYVEACSGQWYMDDCSLTNLPVSLGEVPDDPVGKRGGIHTDYIDTANRPTVLRRATGALDVTADNLSQHSEVTDHIGGLGVPTVSLDTKVTDGTSRFAWKASQQTALITNKGGENHVIDPNFTSTDFWPVSNTVNLGGDGTIRSGPLTPGGIAYVDNLDGRGNKAITKCEPGDLVGSLFKVTGAGGQGVNWNIIFVESTGADISPIHNAGVQTAVGTYEMTPVAAPANAVGVRGQWAFHDETGGTGGVTAASPMITIGPQTLTVSGGAQLGDARNTRTSIWASAGSIQSTNPLNASYNPSTGHASISIGSHTLYNGANNPVYNAGTLSIPNVSGTYYVLAYDPDGNGGAVTYSYVTSAQAVLSSGDGYYYVGKVVYTAGSGGSGTGGGGGITP